MAQLYEAGLSIAYLIRYQRSFGPSWPDDPTRILNWGGRMEAQNTKKFEPFKIRRKANAQAAARIRGDLAD